MIDVFDTKTRMRHGTFNLFLWKNQQLDMSIECTTPGLLDSNEDEESYSKFVKINQLLQKIHYYHKKEKQDDLKEWIDRTSSEEIYQQLLKLYLECNFSMIEVSFPGWPYPVLYQDQMYDEIKEDYCFPLQHI